jgi:hypothetical protein
LTYIVCKVFYNYDIGAISYTWKKEAISWAIDSTFSSDSLFSKPFGKICEKKRDPVMLSEAIHKSMCACAPLYQKDV